MLIERGPSVQTRHVYTQSSVLAGTAYVVGIKIAEGLNARKKTDDFPMQQTFEDHKVPVGNLLGKLNEGFKTLMLNFNREVRRFEARYEGPIAHLPFCFCPPANDDRRHDSPHVAHRLCRRITLRPPSQNFRQVAR